MSDYDVAENIQSIRAKIADAAIECGRSPDSVHLLAVSKTKPSEAVQAAYDVGQREFGENKLQDLADKRAMLPDDIRWHMIGHLQTNKVKIAVENSWLIHSVDSEKLLTRTNRIAGELGKVQKILLQANISGETTKFGEDTVELERLTDLAVSLDSIELCGYMTMAPFDADHDALLQIFSALRDFRNRMAAKHGCDFPELSMGMTGDFAEAIACGATYVRIGTAIFGARNYG